MKSRAEHQDYYRGIRMEPYDLIKEALVALGVVTLVVVIVAILFSSPDEPPMTLRSASTAHPERFLQDALSQLDGTSDVATYGPPYNYHQGNAQWLGPISLQKIGGVWIPINTKQDFVLGPLSAQAQNDATLASELKTFEAASPAQQQQWEQAYGTALDKASISSQRVQVPQGSYGPVGMMMRTLLTMGQTGTLDGQLMVSNRFYVTDYTKPLLFLGKPLLTPKAQHLHLLDTQWGMMNETGSWPGQAWLWLYTFWYQVQPFAGSASADAWVLVVMGTLSAILVVLPWIPGLNRLPRYLGVYRIIWRDYYHEHPEGVSSAAPTAPATGEPV